MVLAFILLLLIFGIGMYLITSGIILVFVLAGFPVALMVTNIILGGCFAHIRDCSTYWSNRRRIKGT